MKKIASVLLVVLFVFVAMPNVEAAKRVINNGGNTRYGKISVDEEVANGISTTEVYITKSQGNFIYITVAKGKNIASIDQVYPGSGFNIVSREKGNDGSVTVLLESVNGVVSSEKHILDIGATLEDPTTDCELQILPLNLNCTATDGKYFIGDNDVTEDIYNKVCSNVELPPKDQGNTGLPVPYIAIAGGLLAIAGVYLYSRKSNKMYKI